MVSIRVCILFLVTRYAANESLLYCRIFALHRSNASQYESEIITLTLLPTEISLVLHQLHQLKDNRFPEIRLAGQLHSISAVPRYRWFRLLPKVIAQVSLFYIANCFPVGLFTYFIVNSRFLHSDRGHNGRPMTVKTGRTITIPVIRHKRQKDPFLIYTMFFYKEMA